MNAFAEASKTNPTCRGVASGEAGSNPNSGYFQFLIISEITFQKFVGFFGQNLGRRSVSKRQKHAKGGALAELTFDFDSPAVQYYYFFNNGKAEASKNIRAVHNEASRSDRSQ